jgi:hypothetical protein
LLGEDNCNIGVGSVPPAPFSVFPLTLSNRKDLVIRAPLMTSQTEEIFETQGGERERERERDRQEVGLKRHSSLDSIGQQ